MESMAMVRRMAIRVVLIGFAATAMFGFDATPGVAGTPRHSSLHRPVRPSRTTMHHQRAWSTYPNYAWGPPWGSFSLYVAPGTSSVAFNAPALSYPWYRFANPAIRYQSYDAHGIYYAPTTGATSYWLPPVYMPAELAYGPTALMRFMGVPSNLLGAGAANSGASAPAAVPTTPNTIRDRIRKSNAVTRARAMRFVQFGNALFQKQRYHEATQRYRSAIEAAPDVAEAYYCQAYSLVATHQYDLAARAFRIALQLDADVTERFRIAELYGSNRMAQNAHLEQIARAALADPENADLLMIVGLFLHDNGQPDRAKKFIAKARQLAGPGADFLLPLINAPVEEPPAEEVLAGVDT